MTLTDIQNEFEKRLQSKDIRITYKRFCGKVKNGWRYSAIRLNDGARSSMFINEQDLEY